MNYIESESSALKPDLFKRTGTTDVQVKVLKTSKICRLLIKTIIQMNELP